MSKESNPDPSRHGSKPATMSHKDTGIQYIRTRPPPTPASFESHQSQEARSSSAWHPQVASHAPNREYAPHTAINSVLSSLIQSTAPHGSPRSKHAEPKTMSYASYIKNATPGAFSGQPSSSKFRQPSSTASKAVNVNGQGDQERTGGEVFDLDANVTIADSQFFDRDAEKHMRELLSGAIGEGEDDEAEEAVEINGLAEGVTLMPHQIRGVRWLKKREAARNFGGILADDMGLGKTVQMIARICERKANAVEQKSGYAGTLVVAPLAVMEQWAGEIRTKTTKDHVKVTTHHGPSRTKLASVLKKYDVVITTFHTLGSEYSTSKSAKAPTPIPSDSDSDSPTFQPKKKTVGAKKQAASPLFDLKWLRVVVDEAQNIKNHNTLNAKAATALQAKYRWCLTGTPIQNKVEELYSLFKFLDIKPLNAWETFKRQIAGPIKNGQTKVAMKRLHVVLNSIMLRRTKDATINGKPILNLPGRTVNVVDCPFDDQERAFYQLIEGKMNDKLQRIVMEGSATNYTSVLTLLLRLRQACLHPALLREKMVIDAEDLPVPGNTVEAEAVDVEDDDDLANLLGGLAVDDSDKKPSPADIKPAVQEGTDSPVASSKIRMLLELLEKIRFRGERTIVFSQFTSFLDILGPFLVSKGIAFVRYDGSMRNDKRQESLEKIKTDPKIKVILISFKSGSTGLNLTACNNVVLMDLWWNPALEDQAFDRAHRLGQKLDVNIYKLTVSGTVEDRILALQDTKRELARAALSGEGAKNTSKLSMNELLGLFRSSYHRPDDE